MALLLKPPNSNPKTFFTLNLPLYYNTWFWQSLSFSFHSASLLSVLAATPSLDHQHDSILTVPLPAPFPISNTAAEHYSHSVQIPSSSQLKPNLKNLKSSPPLRKHSPYCLARYSRSSATCYQLSSPRLFPTMPAALPHPSGWSYSCS